MQISIQLDAEETNDVERGATITVALPLETVALVNSFGEPLTTYKIISSSIGRDSKARRALFLSVKKG